MPYFAGRIWPEITHSMTCSGTLRVAIDEMGVGDPESRDIRNAGGLLNRYFADLRERRLKIEIDALMPEPELSTGTAEEASPAKGNSDKSTIATLAKQARSEDADILVTKHMSFENRAGLEREHDVTIVDSAGAMRAMEYFAAGHNVPWSFRLPCWNMPWSDFYSMTDKDGKRGTTAWMSAQFKRLLSPDAQEIFRSLSINRMEHILYTRDMLLFWRFGILCG